MININKIKIKNIIIFILFIYLFIDISRVKNNIGNNTKLINEISDFIIIQDSGYNIIYDAMIERQYNLNRKIEFLHDELNNKKFTIIKKVSIPFDITRDKDFKEIKNRIFELENEVYNDNLIK